MNRVLGILLCSFLFSEVDAQTPTGTNAVDSIGNHAMISDSSQHRQDKLRPFIVPAALITYGSLSFAIPAIRNVDYSIHNEMTKHYSAFRTPIDNYLQFAPTVGVYALNLAGVKGKNSFIDRSAILFISEAIFYGTTVFLKSTTGRLRPDESNKLSWPSGHAGNAFVSAEFMAQEFSGRSAWYGVAGYSMAATTSILRIYNDKHWLSDIVAGAGFGILATKTAYYLYPFLKNKLLHFKDNGRKVFVLPSYRNGGLWLTVSANF